MDDLVAEGRERAAQVLRKKVSEVKQASALLQRIVESMRGKGYITRTASENDRATAGPVKQARSMRCGGWGLEGLKERLPPLGQCHVNVRGGGQIAHAASERFVLPTVLPAPVHLDEVVCPPSVEGVRELLAREQARFPAVLDELALPEGPQWRGALLPAFVILCKPGKEVCVRRREEIPDDPREDVVACAPAEAPEVPELVCPAGLLIEE